MKETRRPRPRSTSARRRLIPWGAALAAVALFAGCSRNEDKKAADMAAPVRVADVVKKTVPVTVKTFGTVQPYFTVSVRTRVTAELTDILWQEGQEVKQGDLLFRLDPRIYEAALKQAEANRASDVAKREYATLEAQRAKVLFEGGAYTKDQYDSARATADAAIAQVLADEAAIASAKVNLSYCTISSPIDALTGLRLADKGNIVKENDSALVVLNQIHPIAVTFSAPEQYLADIRRSMSRASEQKSALPVTVTIPGDETGPPQGTLVFVDNAIDATTGMIKLKATFENKDRRLWPGQYLFVTLELEQRPDALVIPSAAVEPDQEGHHVFVIKSDMTAEMRTVELGFALDGDVVVEKGVAAGERVVVDGQLRLTHGAKVEIKTGSLSEPSQQKKPAKKRKLHL